MEVGAEIWIKNRDYVFNDEDSDDEDDDNTLWIPSTITRKEWKDASKQSFVITAASIVDQRELMSFT